MNRRIAIISSPPSGGWTDGSAPWADRLAAALRDAGHDVQTFVPSDPTAGPSLLTAVNRHGATRRLFDSHRLACSIADYDPKMVIAPLQGGLAQSILMARACKEGFAEATVVLWNATPTACRTSLEETVPDPLCPLVDDAMERQCLSLADALIVRADEDPAWLPEIAVASTLPLLRCPTSAEDAVRRAATELNEIVFPSPLCRSHGAGEFIAAIEELAHEGILGDRLVTFVGPAADTTTSLGLHWLGQKASRWAFRFRVRPTTSRVEALSYAAGQGRLPVVISSSVDELDAIRACNPSSVVVRGIPLLETQLVARVKSGIKAALNGRLTEPAGHEVVDWARLAAALPSLEPRVFAGPPGPRSVTVCVLHYDRLALVRRALASIPDTIAGTPVEVIVLDNASPIPEAARALESCARPGQRIRVIVFDRPVPQAHAYNVGLREAQGEAVAFLDDDNFFEEEGLERMVRGLAAQDVVVSSLDIFDDDLPDRSGRREWMLFLGSAHSAGLFFNLLGDTAMVVRKSAFAEIGGFYELEYDYPSFDWVSLARVHGAGLRLGALQRPAVCYRRNTARADLQPIKLDEAGSRAFVHLAYAGDYDARLVARYAQMLQLKGL